jgi:hypothetical protein
VKTLLILAAAALAQGPAPKALPSPAQQPQQIVNLSLVEALSAVEKPELAGIFGFVPEANAPFALADFLMRDRSSLKRFIKKCREDYKVAQGVNAWDKQVLLFLVGLNGSAPMMGLKPMPESWMDRVNDLALAPGLPLQIIVQRRSGG